MGLEGERITNCYLAAGWGLLLCGWLWRWESGLLGSLPASAADTGIALHPSVPQFPHRGLAYPTGGTGVVWLSRFACDGAR